MKHRHNSDLETDDAHANIGNWVGEVEIPNIHIATDTHPPCLQHPTLHSHDSIGMPSTLSDVLIKYH